MVLVASCCEGFDIAPELGLFVTDLIIGSIAVNDLSITETVFY